MHKFQEFLQLIDKNLDYVVSLLAVPFILGIIGFFCGLVGYIIAKRRNLDTTNSWSLLITGLLFGIASAALLGSSIYIHHKLLPKPIVVAAPPTGFLEDVGKRSVVNLPEVEALRQKYGDQRLFIKALDRHLIGHEAEWHTDHAAMMEHNALLYSVRPDWDPKITGCVIVVYAAGEGYVYQEDKNLQVIGTETLSDFFKKTEKVPPEMMYRFYLSLH